MFANPKYFIRQGASLARGTSIDGYLSEKQIELLYSNWRPQWPEPLAYSGGLLAITCEMVLEVPEDEFIGHFPKRDRAEAKNVYTIAQANAGR